uniref:Uncharacterized protein n=1 Tax=Anopheles minimus TaxID=112268 RepID=A0A182W215_9DIPT
MEAVIRKLLQEAEERIVTMVELMNEREQNIRECEHQINELSAKLAAAQSELDSLREENNSLAMDLEATKELCNKLDLQKDKLQAELEEHSNIRELLAREKGTLQKELTLARTGDRAAVDGLQELLTASRTDVEQHRIALANQQQETEKLRAEVDSLRRRLSEEQETARRSGALASEYGVQVQELRRRITDERFAQIRSRAGESTEREDIEDDEDDCNRISRYLEAANKAREKRSKDEIVAVKCSKENHNVKVVQTMATQTTVKKQKRSNTREKGVQKSELKMVAPIGWKITKYERSVPKFTAESSVLKTSDTDQSQDDGEDDSVTSHSLDGHSVASEAYTSLSYEIIDQRAPEDGGVDRTVGASGIVKGQMDGTGSTVVIYKTETGERLELRDFRTSDADRNEKRTNSRMHPSDRPLVNAGNAGEAVPPQQHCATIGRVMIIDEPSVGASFGTEPDAIDCNTTVTAANGAETTVDTAIMFWTISIMLTISGTFCVRQLEASVRITNYTDEWDPKYLDVDLRVRRLDQTTAIDFDLDLKQELDKNVEYDVRLCKRVAGKYHQMMYTGKQQLCGKELRRSRNLLDRYIASELVKHSNLTTRCPIKTGHYEVRNFEIDDRHLMMSVVPSGEFLIEVGVYHRGKEIKMNRWFVTAT